MSARNFERSSSESSNDDNDNESTGSSSPDHEAEAEADFEPEPDADPDEDPDLKDLDMGNAQYTAQDQIYSEELGRTCPPAPLFVLRWNRASNPRQYNQQPGRNWESQNSSRTGNHGYDHHRQERSK